MIHPVVTILGFLWIFVFSGTPTYARPVSLWEVQHWFILLNDDDSTAGQINQQMQRFDMAILDPDRHSGADHGKGKPILIAYVSLGEAESYRSYWDRIRDRPWILWENPDWRGNYFVDVRPGEWQTLLIRDVIPAIVAKGFQGLFLDTLDTASSLEEKNPKKYAGSSAAMVRLVREIHNQYPGLFLISNNGLELLPHIAPFLSGVLVEDLHSMPDFEHGGYRDVPPPDRESKSQLLKETMEKYRLPVFVVDYVARGDERKIRECIERSRRLGFKPYVAEKDLSEIYTFGLEKGS